jgi:hypothetical protein
MIYEIIIAFIGIFFGALLKNSVPKEIKDGRKYIVFFKDLILLSIVIILIGLNFSYMLFLGIFIGFFLRFVIKNTYLYFGLALSFNYSLLLACLIFIFGINYGALYRLKYEFLYFLPLVFLLFTIPNLGINNLIIGISVGGIFNALRDY